MQKGMNKLIYSILPLTWENEESVRSRTQNCHLTKKEKQTDVQWCTAEVPKPVTGVRRAVCLARFRLPSMAQQGVAGFKARHKDPALVEKEAMHFTPFSVLCTMTSAAHIDLQFWYKEFKSRRQKDVNRIRQERM